MVARQRAELTGADSIVNGHVRDSHVNLELDDYFFFGGTHR